ncbi:hypothetical protein H0G86_013119 [Trichoderma simmonsii]|uniref:Uncharacterized protein n=1 Tax=Trichoderma simmonsii TaxID=1491479 RepID=A0A8G0LRQ0_9HYPO|nr:hypothetical protein H0G86_013119 [Trichoderma simmonsii]
MASSATTAPMARVSAFPRGGGAAPVTTGGVSVPSSVAVVVDADDEVDDDADDEVVDVEAGLARPSVEIDGEG